MLSDLQIIGAINQMIISCELKQQNYEMVCARGLLNELGFGADADQIIDFIYDGGFTNCLDPSKATTSYPDFKPEYPSADVCYWGPDQMSSRLFSLNNVPRKLFCR